VSRRALLSAALVLCFSWFGAASAAPKPFVAAPALSVRAGVGGAARPGRWMPVDVTVSAGDTPLRGAVVVEWGGAVARRDIDIAALSSTQVTLLARTIAATPAVRVSVVSAGGSVAASSETALTLLPVDDPATLCIGPAPDTAGCAVTIPESEAPASWRGFDLADEVIWDTTRSAASDAANALLLWRAARWWQDSGFVDPVVAPFDSTSRLSDRTSASLMAFVVTLVILSGLVTWRRAPLWLAAGVPLAVAVAGSALVTRSSRDVDMQAVSFVHEFAGVPQAIVLMKGEVEHPGASTLELTPEIDGATVDVVHGLQRTESAVSAEGRAIYRNTAGRGVKQRFELNGVVEGEWLRVTQRAGDLAIENHSQLALADCQLRSTDTRAIGPIAAGAVLHVARADALAPEDAVVCSLPADWMKWSARGASTATRGTAYLILHMWPATAAVSEVASAAR
jgi:hypothetical protein